jgi:hypothetical protein
MPALLSKGWDPVGRLLLDRFVAKPLELVLDRDVGDVP